MSYQIGKRGLTGTFSWVWVEDPALEILDEEGNPDAASLLEKYRLYVQNPLFDQKRNAEKLAEAMGDDPKEMVTEQAPQMPMAAPQAQPGQAQEMAQQEMVQ